MPPPITIAPSAAAAAFCQTFVMSVPSSSVFDSDATHDREGSARAVPGHNREPVRLR
jgi:hypothetical protein